MTRAPLWLVATCLLCAPLHAQPSALEQQTAQALFDEARTLMKDGRTAEACARFAESQRLDPGGGTLLNLAVCHEKLGLLASAYAEYSEALSQAIVARRPDRQRTASAALAALGPRLPRLRLLVESPGPDQSVTLDDQPVARSLWGQATPVDPGPHRLAARAPGRQPFASTVELREGVSLDVRVPALETAPDPVASSPPAASSAPTTSSAPTPPPLASSFCADGRPAPCAIVRPVGGRARSSVRPAAFAVSITSVLVMLSTGATAYILKSASGCDAEARRCPTPGALGTARSARTVAWISTGAAGLGVASGLLYLLWPEPRERVDVSVSRESVSLSVLGVWP